MLYTPDMAEDQATQEIQDTPPATLAPTGIQPMVISAPFGNYIQPQHATATLGTFTVKERPGRVWRIIKTVRYYPGLKAWVNKIGLRNPGMPWLIREVELGRKSVDDKIVSIHGFTPEDWTSLLSDIVRIKPMAVELNMSCPNVGEIGWPESLFEQALQTEVEVIVKLPPVRFELMARQAIDAGVRTFHCCNTLPVPSGGLSGKPVMPVTMACIRELRGWWEGESLRIIGGGGITTCEDIDAYVETGVQHVALGTKTMNPLLLLTYAPIVGLVDHAIARLA